MFAVLQIKSEMRYILRIHGIGSARYQISSVSVIRL